MQLTIFYFHLFLSLPLLYSTSPLIGCQKSLQNECDELESKETSVNNSNSIEDNPDPEKRLMENMLGDLYSTKNKDDEDDLRTWRINHKALVPILIGLAVKSLAMIALTLTGLSIIGAISILFGKVSLAISSVMFLKRFFSHDHSSGGFFGLNPLGFPHPPFNAQSTKHRRIMNGNNSIRRHSYDDIIGNIDKYREKLQITQ